MTRVGLIEETLRDGQLSLWATRMDTDTMLGAAGRIDRAGFDRACVGSGAAFDTAVKFLHEDPWARLEAVKAAMPVTPLEFLVRGRNLIGWQRYSDDVVDLFYRALHTAGMNWALVFDGLNDLRNLEHHVRAARGLGIRTAGVVVFTESPVHTDDYFVAKTAAWRRLGADTVCFYDGSGILTPQRMARLAPRLLTAAGGPDALELNVHTNTGLGRACYIEAMRAGVRLLASCARPLAYGASLPSTLDVASDVNAAGLACNVDVGEVAVLDEYFAWICEREQREIPAPIDFDRVGYDAYVAHQVPGGMISNFRRQLSDAGMSERLPQILEEIVRVRREIGWPPMVTPYSQTIGVQATLNVMSGQRYRTSPSELAPYLLGEYGEIPGPVDPDVMDRVLSGSPQRVPIDPTEVFSQRMLAQTDALHRGLDDRERVLALFYDDATRAALRTGARPIRPERAATTPMLAIARELLEAPRARRIHYVRKLSAVPTYDDAVTLRRMIGAGSHLTTIRYGDASVRWSLIRETERIDERQEAG